MRLFLSPKVPLKVIVIIIGSSRDERTQEDPLPVTALDSVGHRVPREESRGFTAARLSAACQDPTASNALTGRVSCLPVEYTAARTPGRFYPNIFGTKTYIEKCIARYDDTFQARNEAPTSSTSPP